LLHRLVNIKNVAVAHNVSGIAEVAELELLQSGLPSFVDYCFEVEFST